MTKIFVFLFLFFNLNSAISNISNISNTAKLSATERQWLSVLNQRWLLSQEIAAYQYYHALDPPEILTPTTASLVQYGVDIGLTENQARVLIQMIHRIDQRLQARWLVAWQRDGFNFDNGHFMNAPSLCLKQEGLERQLLKKQAELLGSVKLIDFDVISQGLMVPKLLAADKKELWNTIRVIDSQGV
jgi:hypothetical protein